MEKLSRRHRLWWRWSLKYMFDVLWVSIRTETFKLVSPVVVNIYLYSVCVKFFNCIFCWTVKQGHGSTIFTSFSDFIVQVQGNQSCKWMSETIRLLAVLIHTSLRASSKCWILFLLEMLHCRVTSVSIKTSSDWASVPSVHRNDRHNCK